MIQSNLFHYLSQNQNSRILLVADDKEALEAYQVAQFLFEENKNNQIPLIAPDFRAKKGDDLRSFYEEFIKLLSVLRIFYSNDKTLLIAPFSSLLYPMPKKELLDGITILRSDPIDLDSLKEQLIFFGYEVVDVVEMPGEVSFRGDILDIGIFENNDNAFYRFSFFDIECESIRKFDPQTQKSDPSELDSIFIPPALFHLKSEEYQKIQEQIQECDFESFSKDIFSLGFWFLENLAQNVLEIFPTAISPQALEEIQSYFEEQNHYAYTQKFFSQLPVIVENANYQDLKVETKNLEYLLELNSRKKILILVPTELIRDEFLQKGIQAKISNLVINITTPDTLILSLNSYPKTKRKIKPKIAINELNVGEYIVHSNYGIGIFRGIKQVKALGCLRDFIEISYQGNDTLLLPVENLNLIDRYIASSSGVPMVDKLGKGNFIKLKEKVKEKLLEIASSIISLAAKRSLIEGKKIDTNIPEITLFQKECGFKLTPDQEKSIQEMFDDLSSGRVMDRLLSGDVGFGKTEVALNGIFAVCKNGYQALMVVPTTLLAMQHFKTLKSRLHNLNIVRLDRFCKTSEKSKILTEVKEGKIDVVIGTHSVLGLEFKNLGLIIIDEEHKFGVKQKEEIKSLSQDVHLLSMSATPIPRTLNMALSQIKGMSTLLTPPQERQGSKTFIKEKSDSLVKEAILRELRRNGQVFYIHNNISQIPFIKDELLTLLPQLNVAVLHSKIDTKETEKIMLDFVEKKYQLLLCTSIVESGIHLPNANTIIVDGADHFGLADLHQLRGRVGRGEKEGYCYFLINSQEDITPEAKKRLLALEKNSFLGSGAMIAYQDLEIRGGGNLLGQAQSGHIKNIGYSLYLKMLEDAIYQLSGHEKLQNQNVELKLQVSAFLSPDLISSDTLRLELYRRLSLCKNIQEVYEIEEEIQDRFGAIDENTRRFLSLILIKILASELEIVEISSFKTNVCFVSKDREKEFLETQEEEMLTKILEFLRKKMAHNQPKIGERSKLT